MKSEFQTAEMTSKMRNVRALFVLFTSAIVVLPPSAGQGVVGSSSCQACHLDVYQRHAESPHALALKAADDSGLMDRLESRPIREDGLAYIYGALENGWGVSISRSAKRETAQAPLEWVFGSGSQGRTPVTRVDGRWVEHRVSYYTGPDKPAITLGHPLESPPSAAAALGRRMADAEALRCFNCHATGVRTGFDGPDLSRMTPGVQCERCHGPGAEHVETVGRDPARAAATIDGRRGTAAETLAFCGQCHRADDRELTPGDPLNVRFQPIGLARSRCYQESGTLTCTSCHDPHEAVSRDAAAYSAVCAGCHAAADAPAGCGREEGASCLPCHMPRTQPNAYLEFTDHEIQ